MNYVGFWKRLLSYTLDIIPIFLIVFFIFYFLLGFDHELSTYYNSDHTLEARKHFLAERNKVRDSALLMWIFYGFLMEYSIFQGTHGKIILGIKVVSREGKRISLVQSFIRSCMKIVGAIPLFLGFIWAAFRKDKAGWHDLVAKTHFVKC